MRDYRKLDVWRIARELNKLVYGVSGKFPKEEVYGLTSQIRRASVSVSSNIAEGCGRRTKKNFVQFLHNATGSLKEVSSQLSLAKDLEYVSGDDFDKLNGVIIKLSKKLLSFVKYIGSVEDNRIYK
jgi:four helix bundle protein